MEPRTSQQLIRASKVYARESRALSWWHLLSTLTLFSAALSLACLDALRWYGRGAAGFIAGLLLIRLFIIYHDYQHGTILKGSKIAGALMYFYGLLTLNPPSIWNRSHNHHHKNNAKIYGAAIGSYPVMTTEAYAAAGWMERFLYRVSRHPLTIVTGYATVFLYGMCIRSLLSDFRHHIDSAISIVVHFGIIVLLAIFQPDAILPVVVIPSAVAAAAGAYLFYAQHNYPGVVLRERSDWDYATAALKSSSFIRMSPLMHWITGNIGYHHVHHLNAHIPFYRLPEAMRGMEELQSPTTTSLAPRDIAACFRLKLWDTARQQLVPIGGA